MYGTLGLSSWCLGHSKPAGIAAGLVSYDFIPYSMLCMGIYTGTCSLHTYYNTCIEQCMFKWVKRKILEMALHLTLYKNCILFSGLGWWNVMFVLVLFFSFWLFVWKHSIKKPQFSLHSIIFAFHYKYTLMKFEIRVRVCCDGAKLFSSFSPSVPPLNTGAFTLKWVFPDGRVEQRVPRGGRLGLQKPEDQY